MAKSKVLMVVGAAMIAIGLLLALLQIIPLDETKEIEVGSEYQFLGFSYSGLMWGHISGSYEVQFGHSMKMFIFTKSQYESYFNDEWAGSLHQDTGSSGSFSVDFGLSDGCYVVFEHMDLSDPLAETVIVEYTLFGVSVAMLVFSIVLVAAGLVLAIMGRKMRATEAVSPPNQVPPVYDPALLGPPQQPPGQQ